MRTEPSPQPGMSNIIFNAANDQLEGSKPTKTSRANSSRSRSGCNTCKIRRVKCDERKPGCQRCDKFGRICDGYEVQKRPTAPKPKSKLRNQEMCLTPLLPLVPATPSQITFQDESQEQHFWFFRNETARWCSNGWTEPIWQECVPKACHDEPCILNGAVAIAALDRSHRLEIAGASRDEIGTQHQYALRQYGEALKGIQEVLTRKNHTRTVLIASILIYGFENLHANPELAISHIRAAIVVMANWFLTNGRKPTALGYSPIPTEIEDVVLETYIRLDRLVSDFMPETKPVTVLLQHMASNELSPLPAALPDLVDEAQKLEGILDNAFIFMKMAPGLLRLPVADRAKIIDEDGVQLMKPPVLEELCDWQNNFHPLILFSSTLAGKPYLLRIAILRMVSVRLTITIRMALFDPKKPQLYDLFLPEFSEIVTLVSSITSSPEYLAGVELNTSMLAGLFLVLTTCTDRVVKREAIRVLKKMDPRKEGLWDSAKILEIGEALLKGHNNT